MSNSKQKIMTINAKALFKYYPIKKNDEKTPFCFDTRKRTLYTLVVKQEVEMDECPLFHQIIEVLKANKVIEESDVKKRKDILYNQFLIMDFEDIFMPDENATDAVRKLREGLRNNVGRLIENGLDIYFEDKKVHMVPFDKSGNMSRNGRISFVNDMYLHELNVRLNLGMDFNRISVHLSKYYAYRGLYLSTSRRVKHKSFEISPETFVIVKDRRMSKEPITRGPRKGQFLPVLGENFERDVIIETARKGMNEGEWIFEELEKKPLEYEDTPYDGEGVILPSYSEYINDDLKLNGASSYQIRMPFVKGMVHKVDVLAFLDEFSTVGKGEKEYWYEDAFGINRDLRKAKLLVTESMFKGKGWLLEHCQNNAIKGDPMKYYCDMFNSFCHALYVSGTNLPYGHSQYTHLSYQAINTLAFSKEQFDRIIERHVAFIQKPLDFLRGWEEAEKADSGEQENDLLVVPNWKRAVMTNEDWKNDIYIKGQLNNIQKGLLTKLATGKILVEGQTRYLCRDLLPLLACLLSYEKDIKNFYKRCLWQHFYMPFGKDEFEVKTQKLDYLQYYAFFRNPHLSRNEQSIMQPFVPTDEKNYFPIGDVSFESFNYHLNIYHRYFSHLTGIVMVPRGSILPLCLGGADFDGDLVSIIFNQDVVDAVKRGAYEKCSTWWRRRISAVKIPDNKGKKEVVPQHVPYSHIYNTFYNRIGQISNAAISIGQVEYNRNNSVESEFDANVPTCDKCTLLTGLEIDAAKNGVHPNLDLILKSGISKSAYLTFLRQFKELTREKYFHLDKITINEEKKLIDGIEKTVYVIGTKNCDTEVMWCPDNEKTGTYINLLPKYFLEYYQVFSKVNAKKEKVNLKKFKLSKDEKVLLKEFKESCDGIIELYLFYKNTFLRRLTWEKNRGYHAVENAEIMIMRKYDEEYVDTKLFETLPGVRDKIVNVLVDDSEIRNIRERINTEQWLFQPPNRRGQVLEKIIGNGFKETDLTEDERELLCHFNQQGYKMLWRIMDLIEGPKVPTFEYICENLKEEREELLLGDCLELESLIKKKLKRYYEKNALNVEQDLYNHCIEQLKNIIGTYKDSVDDISKLVVALYQQTKSKASKTKFFWDVFTWEELQCIVEDKGENEEC